VYTKALQPSKAYIASQTRVLSAH